MARKCRFNECRKELPKGKDCNDGFQRAGFCDPYCMADHALKLSREVRDKRERKELLRAKERIKTKPQRAREAQRDFNAYIRKRDHKLPCISCGRHHQGQYHAGHYRSVGANPELRFEELNCHKQCAPCNNHKSGNVVEYRLNLINRIGQDNLDWLEGPHDPKKYTADDLKKIGSYYRAKCREMNKL
jgi:hypothetical protein